MTSVSISGHRKNVSPWPEIPFAPRYGGQVWVHLAGGQEACKLLRL